MRRTIPELIQDLFFSIIQILSIPLIYFLYVVLKPQITKPKGLVVPRGTLIISNHQSVFDPWFVGNFMGLRNLLKNLPMRFPVTPKFFRRPFMGTFIWCFGGFDIGLTPLEKAKKLLFIRELIHKKYTVLLFPEGRIVKDKVNQAEFKRGMTMLASEDIPFLVAHIDEIPEVSEMTFRNSGIKIRYSNIIKNVSSEEKMNIIQEFFSL